MELRVFHAINRQRALHGVPALNWNETLAWSARQHSERMLEGGFFAHQDPSLGDIDQRISATGLRWSQLAENIFRERGHPDPVALALVEWMYSRGHRGNLLNEAYTETGVGAAISAREDYVFTQQFLRGPEPQPS